MSSAFSGCGPRIVVLEGAPASGKSTLAAMLRYRCGCAVVPYTRLGLVNLVSGLLLGSGGGVYRGLPGCRRDPVVLLGFAGPLPRHMQLLMFLLELFYKLLVQLRVMLAVLVFRGRCLVVDEFIAMALANYMYLARLGVLRPWMVRVLFLADVGFAKFLSLVAGRRLLYRFVQPRLALIERLHRSRCSSAYDYLFLAVLSASARTVRGLAASKRHDEC